MIKKMKEHSDITLFIVLPVSILLLLSIWYALSLATTKAEEKSDFLIKKVEETSWKKQYGDYYVVVHLDTNKIILHDGTKKIMLEIVSQGKPGSYYETIGGAYTSDYKEPLHFSSIGHVYMPYSIHIFGNYFIHGIPYYPNGEKVSSAYSGGCIRLIDSDMEVLYNFISTTTPIIITRGGDSDFIPIATIPPTLRSEEMTKLMVATISLELLTQDNSIVNSDGIAMTTRKQILPRLLNNNDTRVSTLYAHSLGEKTFIQAMNNKARALGMTNTIFTDVTMPTLTTNEDYSRFMEYITTYKSYLQQF